MRHRLHPSRPPSRWSRLFTRSGAVALAAGLVVSGTVALTTAADAAGNTTPDRTSSYMLVLRSSGKALDVPGFARADGAGLVQWTPNRAANQQFGFVPAGNGWYRVRSVSSGKVLTDSSSSRTDGAPVVQSTDRGGAEQQWKVVRSGSYIQLINRVSGRAMDVTGPTNGARVAQHVDRNAANQQWTLFRVGAAPTTTSTPTTAPRTTTAAPTPTPTSAAAAPAPSTRPPTPASTRPTAPSVAGEPLWVNPDNPAARQVRAWQAAGRTADAATLRRIADQPMAVWIGGGDPGQVTGWVDSAADSAQAAHARAVFVAYDIPGRDCGSYSAGGAGSRAQYAQWVAGFAAGLGGRNAMVVLEPDAIPQQLDGCGPGAERYAALSDAVSALEAAGADVYIDAGHPDWIQDIPKLAAALTSAGVRRAAGFSLNVSNFVPTAQDVAYGKKLSAALGGAHFVIDTSRNGAANPPPVTSGPAWCNPPGHKVGPSPTTRTGDPEVDAYLWIKTPGESDGSCRSGEAPSGGWMPEYALGLAR